MADVDLHIKGGTVVDGTRAPSYRADVWIKDGKLAQIGGRAPGFAKRTIDAEGLIVAPGFVDLHTHYDAQIRWDPYCTIPILHDFRLARRDLGRTGQLRFWLCPGQARLS
jgi:N-acyl-D-amino-acid deacylase